MALRSLVFAMLTESRSWLGTLQDALGVDAFNVSSEALAADALLDAYRSGDEAAIKQVISSKPLFMELDNQVSCA